MIQSVYQSHQSFGEELMNNLQFNWIGIVCQSEKLRDAHIFNQFIKENKWRYQ